MFPCLAVAFLAWKAEIGVENTQGTLVLRVTDETGRLTPVRLEVLDENGKGFIAPDAIPVGGDRVDHAVPWQGSVKDALERLTRTVENHTTGTLQFYSQGESTLSLPTGLYRVTAEKGPEYDLLSTQVRVSEGETTPVPLRMSRWIDMPAQGWYSADEHLHVARTHRELDPLISKWMQAEDVHVATLLQWGNHTSFNNAPQYSFGAEGVYQEGNYLVAAGQENPRTHVLGHTIVLGSSEPIHFPEQYVLYNLFWQEAARQGALSGYAHRGLQAGALNGLSLDLPSNLISFVEVLQRFSNFTAWYNILNTGFTLTPTAGTDYPFGQALPGKERFYTKVDGPLTYSNWLENVSKGRTFVTNGPMLQFRVSGQHIGEEVTLEGPGAVRVWALVQFDPSRDAVERLELVQNGEVVRSFSAAANSSRIEADIELEVSDSGWLALRAGGKKVGLVHPYKSVAHTAAIYLNVKGTPSRLEHPRAKALCLMWAARLDELEYRLFSQYATMGLSNWDDEAIAGGYLLRLRPELFAAIRSARQYFLERAGQQQEPEGE